jgi:hypothetical protein
VCVTSYTTAQAPERLKDRSFTYPCDGFVIPDAFRDLGGAAGVLAMCGACPANAHPDRPAGCAGTLYQYPESAETQEQLERIIDRLGLADAVADAFPPTTPIWYGLWARSPLSPPAVRLLRTIIAAMRDEDARETGTVRERHLPKLDRFVRAAELAEERDLGLHVSMAPPGHTDFGWYTVFPHCPFCKAAARLERWKRSYPTRLYACHACGTQYPPAETASSTRDDYDRTDLRDVLDQRFTAFAASYLRAQGASEAEAAEIVESHEAWEREREERLERDRREARRQDRYIRAVLYAGLHPTYERDDDQDDDDDEQGEATDARTGSADEETGMAWFDAAEFAELLRRCQDRGVKVTWMFHRSASEELERSRSRLLARPLEVLAKWQAEGCREKFGAALRVAKEVLDAFENPG